MTFFRRPIDHQGVALFIVLASMATLAIFVSEITYTAQINQKLAYDRLDQVKAQALAKSGLRLSLLRIRAYSELKKTIGKISETAGANAAMIDSVVPKAMIEKIKGAKGSSLVYSQFLEMEGIGIFTIVMRANGFEPIVIEMAAGGAQFSAETIQSLRKGPQANQPRFITFTGGESEEVRRYAVDVFNAKFSELPKAMADVLRESGYLNNQKGDLCRVFCITSAGAEGLSLKNVRAVHLMEPYWNDVRMSQVKGRAVRICSHMDIQPPSERTVEIFTYISVFSQEAQIARTGPKKIAEAISMKDSISTQQALAMKVPVPQGAQGYTYTSDEHLWFIAEGKKAMIDSLSRIMKSAAVDCQLNFNENNDGTFTCALFGKVGDFMYHPDIDIDIAETNDL
jgi:hypothetical protein